MLTAGRVGAQATDISGSLTANNAIISVAGGSNSGTMTVNGNLSLTGDTLSIGQGGLFAVGGGSALTLGGIDEVVPTVALASGTYNLFTYGSLAGGGTVNLAMGGSFGTSPRQSYAFGTSGGTAITLTVSGLSGNLRWTGSNSNVWDNAATSNWFNTNSNSADKFFTGDNVTFTDSAGTSHSNISVSGGSLGSVSPGSLTVSNTNVDYTFSGDPIAGTTNLLKSGPGADTHHQQHLFRRNEPDRRSAQCQRSLRLGHGNDRGQRRNAQRQRNCALGSGAVRISGGLLTASASQSVSSVTLSGGMFSFATGGLGSGNVTFAGNSTLQWNGGNSQDVSGQLVVNNGAAATIDTQANNVNFAASFGNNSSGSLIKAGSGTLTLGVASTYTGGTTINGGALQVIDTGALGSGAVVDNAALIYNIPGGSINNPISGSGNVSNINATGVLTFAQNIALTNGNFTFNSVGATISSGANFSVGNGSGTISSAVTSGFGVNLSGTNSLSASGTGSITIAGSSSAGGGNGGMNLSGCNLTTAGNINLSGFETDQWGIEFGNPGNSTIHATSGTTTISGDLVRQYFRQISLLIPRQSYGHTHGGPRCGHRLDRRREQRRGIDHLPGFQRRNGLQYQRRRIVERHERPHQHLLERQLELQRRNGQLTPLERGATKMTNGLTVNSTDNSTVTIASASSGTLSGAMTINGNSLTYNIGGTGTVTQSGLVSGSGAVTKNGTGMLILYGANTYTGNTTVSNGTLQLATPTSLGSGGGLTADGGLLDLNGQTVIVGPLSGAAGTITDIGGFFPNVFTVNQSAITNFGGTIQDGAVTVGLTLSSSSTGELTLSGINTYTGGTTVNGGTLIVTDVGGIYDGTNISVGDSGLLTLLPEAVIPSAVAGQAAIAPVPEPGTLVLLLAVGLCSAAMYRRVRKHSSRFA